MHRIRRLGLMTAALAAAAFLAAGCDDDGNDGYHHTPAAGQGAIVVDNLTWSDLEVYVDGVLIGTVGDDDDRGFDLAPGVRRVVLNEEDGSRTFRDDVDVLADRLTVLKVTVDVADPDALFVDLFFD